MSSRHVSQTIVVASGGIPKTNTSVTLADVPLKVLKKYSSTKPLRRRPRRKAPN
jgi:hypothetical protein